MKAGVLNSVHIWLVLAHGLFFFAGNILFAGARSSSNFSVSYDVNASAGARSASLNYLLVDVVGEIDGVSIAASPSIAAKHGFIGQLNETVGIQVTSTPATVDEGDETLVNAAAELDDGTTFRLLGTDVNWSVVSGPVTGLNALGVARAGTVYADANAVVRGAWMGFTDVFSLVVRNSASDNFGSYAGDGLEDGWQVQHFGVGHPQAGPLSDIDLDGLNNLMEYAFGLHPREDSSSQLPQAQRLGGDFIISFLTPVGVQGITHGIEWSTSLLPGSWNDVLNTGTAPQNQFVVPIGSNDKVFFRFRVTIP
ncbi:MAG: hypothetical protein JNJ83_16365 [Verrucomicrobiaceae bacterium]|nr:hypothetical protein [Verrucomicrobiaceae bacterium]